MREFPYECLGWLLFKWIKFHLNSNNATKNACKAGKKRETTYLVCWRTRFLQSSIVCLVCCSLVSLFFLICFASVSLLSLSSVLFSFLTVTKGWRKETPFVLPCYLRRLLPSLSLLFSFPCPLSFSLFCLPLAFFSPLRSCEDFHSLSQSKRWTPVLCVFLFFSFSLRFFCSYSASLLFFVSSCLRFFSHTLPFFFSPLFVPMKTFTVEKMNPCSLCFFFLLFFSWFFLLVFCLSCSFFPPVCVSFPLLFLSFFLPLARSLEGLIYSLTYLYLEKIQCINSRMQIPTDLQ